MPNAHDEHGDDRHGAAVGLRHGRHGHHGLALIGERRSAEDDREQHYGQEPVLGHPVEICKSLRFAVQMAQVSQVPWRLTQIVTLCCCPNWTRDLRRCPRRPRQAPSDAGSLRGGAASSAAGVRKPPKEETALGGRRTVPRTRAKSHRRRKQPSGDQEGRLWGSVSPSAAFFTKKVHNLLPDE